MGKSLFFTLESVQQIEAHGEKGRMRLLYLCRCGRVPFVLILANIAFAQGSPGCGQGINSSYGECKDNRGTPTYFGEICCNPGTTGCAPPGTSCQYCSQGYSPCPAGTTGSKTTANWAYDTSCPGCGAYGGCCNGSVQCGSYGLTCNYSTCGCNNSSPIVIDTTGRGFHLTSVENGVVFDIQGDGHPVKISWTAASGGDALLALDRDSDGIIGSGKELFGNVTQQPASEQPNGFLALAEFDKPENGGNGDGIIDKRDAIFARLLLWIDENHDGISQPNELHSLPLLGVFSLGLRYHDNEHFFDEYGNWFHYQAAVNPRPTDGQSRDGRRAYDVYFMVDHDQPSSTNSTAQSLDPNLRSVSRIGDIYHEGFLYDDLPFARPPDKRSTCPPPRHGEDPAVTPLLQDNLGGTR